MLVHFRERTIDLLLPIVVLLAYAFIFSNSVRVEGWGVHGLLSFALVRGMGGVSIGVLLWHMLLSRKEGVEWLSANVVVFDIIGMCSLIFLVFCVCSDYESYDKYCIIFMIFLILDCMIPCSLFSRLFSSKCWISLGSVTYEMLLIQFPVMYVVHFITQMLHIGGLVCLPLYLVVTVVCAYGYKAFCSTLFRHMDAI